MFEDFGIYGWSEIEPVILSAIVAQKAILLVGDHGANKTESCEMIAKAVLGENASFRHYEVPHLNFDDLMGYTNPKALSSGELSWIETPISIWGADAVLFDEINKTNPFVQGKLHEIVRTRKLMGQETKLKMVFSAVNPPVKYQTNFLDIPLASRYVIVQVPVWSNFTDSVRGDILNKKRSLPDGELKKIVSRAKKLRKKIKTDDVDAMVLAISKNLININVNWSARQAVDLKRMFTACKCLATVTDNVKFTPETLKVICESCVPEISGVVRSTIEAHRVKGQISTTLAGFRWSNPLMTAASLEELVNTKISDGIDILDWMASVKTSLESGTIPDVDVVLNALAKKKISKEMKNKLLLATARIAIECDNASKTAEEVMFGNADKNKDDDDLI